MRTVIFACLILLSFAFRSGSRLGSKWEPKIRGEVDLTDEEAYEMYLDFMVHYNKGLSDEKSAIQRFSTFKNTVSEVIAHNKDKTKSWEKGIHEHSDLTEQEFYTVFPLIE
jgi:hypothetical protein